MICAEFSDIVHELLRPEQPSSELVRRGLEHALLCDDCAAVLAAQRDLNDQLDDLADADRAVAAPAYVERNLLAALRLQHPARPAAFPVWRWAAALGLATAGVLVGAMLLIHHPTEGPAGPAAQPAATPRAASPSMPLEASGAKASAPDAAPSASAPIAEHAALTTTSPAAQTQQSEQFYEIPYAFSGESTDGESVMRVELPASALSSLGIESASDESADSDDGTQMVSADVVVAEDGTLEAIRLAPQQEQQQGEDTNTARY